MDLSFEVVFSVSRLKMISDDYQVDIYNLFLEDLLLKIVITHSSLLLIQMLITTRLRMRQMMNKFKKCLSLQTCNWRRNNCRMSEEIVNYNNINILLINRPMVLQMVPQGDRVGMALMPWMMSAKDDTVSLIGASITAISTPKART